MDTTKRNLKPEKLRTTIEFDPDMAELIKDTMKEQNLDSLKDAVQMLMKEGAKHTKLSQILKEVDDNLVSYYCEEGQLQHKRSIDEGNPTRLSELFCIQDPTHNCKFALSEKKNGFPCVLDEHKEWRALIAKYL